MKELSLLQDEDAHLILFIFHQSVHKVRANESSTSSNQNSHIGLPLNSESTKDQSET